MPIFFDANQRRWRYFKRTSIVAGGILGTIVGVMIAIVAIDPPLNSTPDTAEALSP